VTTLKPEVFHILLALMDGERHGYAIMHGVAERTDGEINLLPGVLYRHLHRLLDGGLIDELDRRSIPEGTDERRRYYRITDDGIAAARAETLRMAKLVEVAKGKDLLVDAGS
jgi:DNA-binding PadR family transcriptional regulator